MAQPSTQRGLRFPMQWRLLTAFVAAFTAVFAFIAVWVVNYASDVAVKRLTGQLLEATEGAARSLPAKALAEVTTLGPDDDPSSNAAYQRVADDLESVRATMPSAEPYTYFVDDGKLLYLVSTAPFRQPVGQTVPPETLTYMHDGLRSTVFEPANTDAFGTWISAYSPILDKRGDTVAAVGMDYSLSYVEDVQRQARAQVFPILVVSYVLLILLVMVVSTLLVRPVRRLTAATKRIADGEYDLDLGALRGRGRFTDEMSDLADSFAVMAEKVAARERALSTEVQRLRVEIDAAKREETVREITETDFFADLSAKAADLRARMHKD
jgi:methyl-accepting chemotaxis protein